VRRRGALDPLVPEAPAVPLVVRLGLLGAVVAGGVLALPSLAAPEPAAVRAVPPGPARVAPSDPLAVERLRQAAATGRYRSWRGSEVVSLAAAATGAAAATLVVDVQHEALAGTRSSVRGARGVQVYDADAGALSGASPLAAADALGDGPWSALVTAAYTVTTAGTDLVAGDTADLVELRWPAGPLAARLAVGRSTGMVVRRELFDGRGRVLRTSAFTELALGPAHDVVPPVAPDPPPGALDDQQLASLRAAGWPAPETLAPGLVLVEARRSGDPAGTTPAPAAAGEGVLQLTWSDGLRTVELFEQRGRLDVRALAGWTPQARADAVVLTHPGMPRRVTWAAGDRVSVLVTDAGDDVLDAALAALPRQRAPGGFPRRARQGLARVGSWLDPTG